MEGSFIPKGIEIIKEAVEKDNAVAFWTPH
jgi:hypothetical protein